MNSFYWAKAAFVSLLMISSIIFEASCTGPVSDLFNSLIVGIISANEGEHSASNQRPLELKLADAQMLQQWIGQIARKIVVEDGIFAGNYLCCPNININAVILTDGLPQERIKKIDKNILKDFKEVQNLAEKSEFLKLLFSFGAMLSAEIGEQSQQNGTLRALLMAYECVGGQFKGISNFAIGAVIKSSYARLKVDKIILESQSIDNLKHRLIPEFVLLNALNIQMTPKDIINFASFIRSNFLSYPPKNPFKKYILELKELTLSNLDKDPVKSRRIAHQLLIHLKNWGTDELKKISLEDYFENVIKLTQRDKCIFGIFTQNLLQRMAKSELLDDYFGELNVSDLVSDAKYKMQFYKRLSEENCYEKRRKVWGEGTESRQQNKQKKENDGIENSKIYPFLAEAIRIDWNVGKEIIQQIDVLSETVKVKKDKKQKKLKEYLESAEFKNAMKIIRVKFNVNEFVLKLKADVKMDNEIEDKINQFCLNLAKIRQICEENIEKYEREMHVIIKQKENHKKFYDFIAIFVKHFGINSIKNDNGGSIEFDLKCAKSFLENVYNLATKKIVKKNESKEYKCLPNLNLNFETEIRAILNKNLNEKAKNLLKEFYVPPKNAEKEGGLKHLLKVNVEAQLFELLFSFAARLEAIFHGKNFDETIEESGENPRDKIRAFLAVPNCFKVPEWANKFSIFDYWMEIKEINSESRMPVIGVAIPVSCKIDENEEAKSISRESYKTLKSLNEYKFAFYESTKLLRKTYDKIEEYRYTSIDMVIPEIIANTLNQISSESAFKLKNNYCVYNQYGGNIRGCEFVKLFQNVSANFLKMKDVTLDTDSWDSNLQDDVEEDFEKFCKTIERMGSRVEEAKIEFLNNVRYDLVIDFKLNAWKDVHDITEDLLKAWTGMELTEETTFAEGNEIFMIKQIDRFTTETNRELISKIEALKANEKDGFDLMGLFDSLDLLVRKIMEEEMPNLEKAKKEKKTEEEIKRIMNVELAREMGKRLGQMLEDVKKHYGQKMDE